MCITSLDINECNYENFTTGCVENSTCVNLQGSYKCECDEEFDGDGKIKCTSELFVPFH